MIMHALTVFVGAAFDIYQWKLCHFQVEPLQLGAENSSHYIWATHQKIGPQSCRLCQGCRCKQGTGAGTNGQSQIEERYKVSAVTKDYTGNIFLSNYVFAVLNSQLLRIKTHRMEQVRIFLRLHNFHQVLTKQGLTNVQAAEELLPSCSESDQQIGKI